MDLVASCRHYVVWAIINIFYKVQGPSPGEEQSQAPVQARADLLESSSVERDLGVLVDNRLTMR